MSDIPIGSPSAPPGRHAAPSGWYPDPVDPTRDRYWDGWQWSRTTRPRDGGSYSSAPAGAGGGQSPVQPGYPSGEPGQPGYPSGEPGQPGQPQGQPGYPPIQSGQPGYPPAAPGYPGSTQPPYPPYQAGYPGSTQPPYQPAYPPYQAGYPAATVRPAPWGGKAQATMTADGVPLAGWWWRALAVFLDSIIVGLLVTIPAFPIYQRIIAGFTAFVNETMQAAQSGQPPPPQPPVTEIISLSDQLLLTAIQVGVALVYHVVFLRWRAATPGKLICGLRVVPVDQGRAPARLAWSSVLPRVLVWVLPGLSAFLLVFRVIDGLFPLWQPKRQALHDLAARTQVVRLRP